MNKSETKKKTSLSLWLVKEKQQGCRTTHHEQMM